MTIAIPRLRRQLKKAMVAITKINMMNRRITEQIIPDELTVTGVPNIIQYSSHGNGSLHEKKKQNQELSFFWQGEKIK